MANIMRLGGGKSKVKVTNVGTIRVTTYSAYRGTATATLNIKNKINNYGDLTVDNFIFGISTMHWNDTNNNPSQNQVNTSHTISYNASTGDFKVITNFSGAIYKILYCDLPVYVITENVERI